MNLILNIQVGLGIILIGALGYIFTLFAHETPGHDGFALAGAALFLVDFILGYLWVNHLWDVRHSKK